MSCSACSAPLLLEYEPPRAPLFVLSSTPPRLANGSTPRPSISCSFIAPVPDSRPVYSFSFSGCCLPPHLLPACNVALGHNRRHTAPTPPPTPTRTRTRHTCLHRKGYIRGHNKQTEERSIINTTRPAHTEKSCEFRLRTPWLPLAFRRSVLAVRDSDVRLLAVVAGFNNACLRINARRSSSMICSRLSRYCLRRCSNFASWRCRWARSATNRSALLFCVTCPPND